MRGEVIVVRWEAGRTRQEELCGKFEHLSSDAEVERRPAGYREISVPRERRPYAPTACGCPEVGSTRIGMLAERAVQVRRTETGTH